MNYTCIILVEITIEALSIWSQVKADKYSGRGFSDNHFSSPRTPSYSYDQEDASNFRVNFFKLVYLVSQVTKLKIMREKNVDLITVL